jgi:hypothetical protein
MRDHLVSFTVATAMAVFLPGAYAARPCAGSSGGSFQYPLGDVRYDSPDPSKADGLSTIAASLGRTPLHECVAQWPESWVGWYEGGSNLVWADCIFTGAGFTQDETVSFAVDWKNKTMYLAHTFACSDNQGWVVPFLRTGTGVMFVSSSVSPLPLHWLTGVNLCNATGPKV